MTQPIFENQNFYAPYFEIKLWGQKLKRNVIRDVLEVSYSDSLDKLDSFEFTLNDWNPASLKPKYSSPCDEKGKNCTLEDGSPVPNFDLNDPDELGRIRVRFPWLSDENISNWARVATPLAGPELGLYCQPEIGDEALVAFEMDDPRFPYILGYLWSGENKPPPEEPTVRLLQTVSGHRLTFDDTEGSEAVKVEDASGNKIIMNADGITIESAADLTIKGNNVNIEATGQLTAKGNPIHLNP